MPPSRRHAQHSRTSPGSTGDSAVQTINPAASDEAVATHMTLAWVTAADGAVSSVGAVVEIADGHITGLLRTAPCGSRARTTKIISNVVRLWSEFIRTHIHARPQGSDLRKCVPPAGFEPALPPPEG